MPGDRPPAALVVGEAAWLLAPAALGLGSLALAGAVGWPAAVLGMLAAAAVALGLGAWRAVAQRGLIRWVRAVEAGDDAEPPDPGAPFGGLVRPIVELARALRRQRAEIAGQLRLFETLLQGMPDPILLVDRERRVLRANDAATRAFGAGIERLALGRAVRDPGVLAAVGAALNAGSGSSVTFHPPGDRARQLAARIEPIELPDGQPGVLMAFVEQGEQVMIERMRSDFVANASHEIRTPLASVHALIETLRGPARDDAAAREQFLEIMAQETARMTRLVEDLLTLSRIELAAHQPPSEALDPRTVLSTAVERLQPVAARNRVTLRVEADPELPAVRGDADQLHQVLVNLIDNAIKYGGSDRTVRIQAAALAAGPADAGPVSGRPCLLLRVVDEGEGIAREHLPRLTERFYRVDKARSRGAGGTGLGLAIVKHILRRHQAHLAIDSEPGRGSTFSVFLPALPGR
ncbi:MAG TPA: ATP-binding protein [Geminicoccaceae bacterium]|nr:ATP-binding protein [Geminicoccus sp.]HMU51592.1 ATP-binding protein [Geminicoccaceae bacterium]